MIPHLSVIIFNIQLIIGHIKFKTIKVRDLDNSITNEEVIIRLAYITFNYLNTISDDFVLCILHNLDDSLSEYEVHITY